ncbi:MAG: hypothetical protein WCR74_16185 [Betaproteobacteria bacterium]
MEGLKDQLAKLFPNLRPNEARPGKVEIKASPHPIQAKASDGDPDDWKKGVTPIAATGRRETGAGETDVRVVRGTSTELPVEKPIAKVFQAPPPRQPVQTATPKVAVPMPAVKATPKLAAPMPAARPTQAKQPVPQAKAPQPLGFGSLKPPALTREAEFKKPEAWVGTGAGLQPPDSGGGRILPVRIGIDFGTAYTKAAVRVGDQVLFVPWSGVRNHVAIHYLPGEISVFKDGEVWLGRAADAERVHSDLKLPFLERNISSREQFCAAVAYLAWVMRYVRAWLYHSHAGRLQGRTLAWEVNLGCPSSSWAARDIRFSYESLGLFAWQLSQVSGDITWEGTFSLAEKGRPEFASIGLDAQVSLMPEFMAQIAGYVHSPQRRNGLHLLMDVGAGTVDLATFQVWHYQQDIYSIFASKVLPLGTHFLMAERSKLNGADGKTWDDMRAVPKAEEFAAGAKVDLTQLLLTDKAFGSQVTKAISELIGHTQTRRYAKAPEWRQGLPAFLAGGGSNCEIYSNSLAAAFSRMQVGLKRTPFPLLEEATKLNGVGEQDFHRLSVAYGLTFDAESMGKILAPDQIKDAPAIDRTVRTYRNRLDRDELYAK